MPAPKLSLKGRALRYLSMREHSRLELSRKLSRYAQDGDDIGKLLDELEAANFLSQERFSESLVNRRAARFGNSSVSSSILPRAKSRGRGRFGPGNSVGRRPTPRNVPGKCAFCSSAVSLIAQFRPRFAALSSRTRTDTRSGAQELSAVFPQVRRTGVVGHHRRFAICRVAPRCRLHGPPFGGGSRRFVRMRRDGSAAHFDAGTLLASVRP
jgi:hypothetical protein